jgi:hypothetical protein
LRRIQGNAGQLHASVARPAAFMKIYFNR